MCNVCKRVLISLDILLTIILISHNWVLTINQAGGAFCMTNPIFNPH